jgi:alkanesulfonate monooxygenase SsuD/methylene tetrahydromethanopterin reductase-like flavin-dependent oxidoreductase (luciferase family)
MAMAFGMHLGHVGGPIAEMRRLWRFADANGFDWFSSADHFQESPYRDGNGDCFEAISTMTAIALDTKHVRVGSLVICVNYRNPGVLAKAICTIDHLSGGRCEIGIGAGWHKHEYEGFGIPFERIGIRQDHLEEAVQILRMLFDQPISNFKGQYFQLNDARCNPKPLQKRLPIWVGGQGEKRTLRTAAKYADGWNAPYIDAPVWKAKNAILTTGARRRAAIHGLSSVPSTWASTWAPTPRASSAARRSSNRTGASGRSAGDFFAARRRTRSRCARPTRRSASSA